MTSSSWPLTPHRPGAQPAGPCQRHKRFADRPDQPRANRCRNLGRFNNCGGGAEHGALCCGADQRGRSCAKRGRRAVHSHRQLERQQRRCQRAGGTWPPGWWLCCLPKVLCNPARRVPRPWACRLASCKRHDGGLCQLQRGHRQRARHSDHSGGNRGRGGGGRRRRGQCPGDSQLRTPGRASSASAQLRVVPTPASVVSLPTTVLQAVQPAVAPLPCPAPTRLSSCKPAPQV